MSGGPKYPDITARLVGADGNVFILAGIVAKAMKDGGVSQDEIKAMYDEIFACTSYDHALVVFMSWVDVQ